MSKTVGIIGAAGGLLTFILEVVSLATPYWIEFEYSLGSSGLWQSCTRSACNSFSNGMQEVCYSFPNLNDKSDV